ncbi:MAG: bifunctional nicotinamidase/pyrazinamidase, partial [Myxococcota bacterium]|nr:bifunctional nicotinamidase/pyrazinamidase [Myxococcota bacterium]
MKALLLVDIQRDFLPGGALAVPEGDAVVPVANRLAARFPLVVATQDWHPEGHVSFASSHPGHEPFDEIEVDGLDQTLWPDHCVQGSRGAGFADDLDLRPVEAIVRKGMDPRIDSYSGFFDNGHRKETGLAGLLRGRGVDEVFLVGLAADVCVAFTARDACELGFGTPV